MAFRGCNQECDSIRPSSTEVAGSPIGIQRLLIIELAPMTYSNHNDLFRVIINEVANSTITDANAPHTFLTPYSNTSRTPRITSE